MNKTKIGKVVGSMLFFFVWMWGFIEPVMIYLSILIIGVLFLISWFQQENNTTTNIKEEGIEEPETKIGRYL